VQWVQLRSTFKTNVILLVACFGVGMTTVSADPSMPAYLTKRSGKTNPESISSDEALWAAYVNISLQEADTPGLGAKHLQILGLSAADSLALSRHIEASMADIDTYSREVSEGFCADRGTIQGSQALYVQALQDMDSKEAARRATHIAKMSDIISTDGKDKFYTWTTTRILPNLTLVSADHAMRVAMLNVDPAVEIERFCSALREPKGATRVQKDVRNGVTVTRISR
jgi:hypothetical protein